ncbi:MAG TPA: hypothetical protein VHL78_05790 [Actinomycetota bacterium]|nr:hypothetical protein [Actinomycetota bacterium]
MRPLPFLLGLALVGSACSGGGDGPGPPLARAPGAATAGLETGAVRAAVVRFLREYAGAERSVGALRRAVAGEELRNWVYWLGVQNAGLRFARPGRLMLRALRVVEIGPDQAAVAVDATVDVFVRAPNGRVVPSSRLFESPVFAVRRGDSWAVVDANRDGRSMLDAITVLEPPPAAEEGGVRLAVDSVFRFSGSTVVNVRLRNGTGRDVRVDLPGTFLAVADAGLPGSGVTASLAGRIPPGAAVEGALHFAPIPLDQVPEGLALRLDGERELTVPVPFPPDAFLVEP